jgi:hypothetical protein
MGSPKSQEIYPSKEAGEKGAWFKDSEGNPLGIALSHVLRARYSLNRSHIWSAGSWSFQESQCTCPCEFRVGGRSVILQEPSVLDDESVWGIQAVDRVNSGIWLESDDVDGY